MARLVLSPGQEDLSALEQQTLAQGPGLSSITLEESQRQQAYREAHPELYAYVPIDAGGGFSPLKFFGAVLAVASLAVPGIGAEIGAAILQGVGITGATAATTASAIGLTATQLSTAVGASALSAANTALQGGTVEDVLKSAASAGVASGLNFGMGGGVPGAVTGSVAGTIIKGGDASQVLTNAFAAGVGAGVQGALPDSPDAGRILSTAATTYITTGGNVDQTLLNTAATAIGTFDQKQKPAPIESRTAEQQLTDQILAESERVGENLGTGTQVAAAGPGTITDAGGGVSVTPQLTKEQEEQIRTNGVYEDENGDIRNPDGSIALRFSQTGGTGGAGAGQEEDISEEARNRQLITVVGLNPEGTDVANTGTPEAKYAGQVGSTSGPQATLPLDFFTNKVFDSPEQKDNFVLQWINLINSSPESSKPTLNAQLNDIRNASVNPAASSTTTSATSELTGGAAAGGGLAGGGGGPPGGQTQTASGGAAGADTQFENDILNLISGGAGSGLGANGGPGAGPLIGAGPGGSTSPTTDAGVGGGTSLVLTNVGPGAGPGVTDLFAGGARPTKPDTSGGGGTLPDLGISMTPMRVPDLGGPPSGGGASTIVGGGGNDGVDPFAGYVRPTAPDTSGGGGTLPGVAPTPMGVPDLGGPPGITGPARYTGPGGPLEDYNSYGGGPVGDTDPFAGYVRPEAPAYTRPTLPDLPAPTPLPPPVMTPPTANVTANVTVDDTYVRPTAPPYTLPTLPDLPAPTPLPPPVMTPPTGNVTVTGGGSNNVANVAYPTITRVPPPPPPKRAPIITGASPARLLADALAAYRPAGAIEGEESGKERQNVWNEKSLRLKDALGL